MRRAGRLGAMVGMALALLGASGAGAATPVQLPGMAGCVSLKGEGGCAAGRAIAEPQGPLVISPDGRSAYLVAHSGREGCTRDAVLFGAKEAIVSADGRNVYVTTRAGRRGARP
jgi:hypothetical protein